MTEKMREDIRRLANGKPLKAKKDLNDTMREGELPRGLDKASTGNSRIREMTLHLVAGGKRRAIPEETDVHAEAELLGALLWSGTYGKGELHPGLVADLVETKVFFSVAHRAIFDAVSTLYADSRPFDVVSAHSWLVAQDAERTAGGLAYLEELVASSAPSDKQRIRASAQVLRDIADRRELEAQLARGDMPSDEWFDGPIEPTNETIRALPTVGVTEIFAPLPPLPYVVQGLHIAPGRPTLIAGYGYSGKTVALQSLALSVATGRPVWGVFQPRRGRVLHLDWEMGTRLNFRRYQRLAAAMGVTKDDLGDALRASVYPMIRIDDDGAEDVLTRAAEGFDLVICDSFTAATGRVDENSSEAGRPLYMLGRISDKTGATFVIVHHARKPQKDQAGGVRMAIRGSGAIFGAADSVFVFAAEKGEAICVSHERSPSDGQHLADFGLAVEDVEIDGDARGGLRVVHVEKEQMAPAPPVVTSSAKFEELKAAILYAVRTGDGKQAGQLPSLNAIAARVKGGNKTAKLQAVQELIDEGQLAQPGGKGNSYRVLT